MRILMIEDDSATAFSVELMLKSEGFRVETTDLGEEGRDLARLYDYDLILLDLGLPDISGMDVLRSLRAGKIATPVLIMTGTSRVDAKVEALNAGADDYLTKPFHKDELVARIHAVVRRSRGHAQSAITVGQITLDLGAKTVRVGEEPVRLTGKEFQMLELLACRRGTTISKEMFLNHLYGGMDEPELKIIDVFICKLRKKLASTGTGADRHLVTTWGRGYCLTADSAETFPTRRGQTARASLRNRVLDRLADGEATFRDLHAAVAPDLPETTFRGTVSVLLGEGWIVNRGGPKSALYRLTDAGRERLPKAAA